MLALKRKIEIDFLGITLDDLANYLEKENFFKDRDFYLAENRGENELVFNVYANRMFGSQTQSFKYHQNKKVLIIESKYKFFPGFYVVFLGLIALTIQLQFDYKNWIKFFITVIIIGVFGFLFGYLNLQYDSKVIQRELIIRVKDIMRKRGHKTPL